VSESADSDTRPHPTQQAVGGRVWVFSTMHPTGEQVRAARVSVMYAAAVRVYCCLSMFLCVSVATLSICPVPMCVLSGSARAGGRGGAARGGADRGRPAAQADVRGRGHPALPGRRRPCGGPPPPPAPPALMLRAGEAPNSSTVYRYGNTGNTMNTSRRGTHD
jgi:hypothetical protein